MGKTRVKPRTISEQLRWFIQQSGETSYSLEQKGIANNVSLSRFLRNAQNLQGSTIDALAEHLGLELVKRGG